MLPDQHQARPAVLERLVADGLVEPDRDEVHHGRLRRYYRLTDRRALAAEAARQPAIDGGEL